MKKKRVGSLQRIYSFLKSNRILFLIGAIFALSCFLRFYEIEERTPFGWDQVDNAWAAKKIIVDNNFPLLGMQAKGNSGVFIGPYYYYLITPFYLLTALDPIAAGLIAGVTSLLSFFVIYIVAKNIFSRGTAIIAIAINCVATAAIISERVQWPVNFIPIVGLLIFFSLYQIARGKSKYILLLALSFGFSLHIHFTSIYYPFIILLMLPFFPKDRETVRYIGLGFLVFIPFAAPMLAVLMQKTSNISEYGQSYYHGFHLRRVMQLTGDAFLQFVPYLKYDPLKWLRVVLFPLFVILYLLKNINRNSFILCYLVGLFYIVPWFVLSTYSGELTDYYFSANRFVSLLIISYILYRFFSLKILVAKIAVIILILIYAFFGIRDFLIVDKSNSIQMHRERALDRVEKGVRIEYQDGVPEVYFYYYYMRKNEKEVY